MEKVDFYVAIMRSQASANWKPAAAAIPLIEQRVGTGIFLKLSISYAQESKIYLGFLDFCNYLRSWPEQKTGP